MRCQQHPGSVFWLSGPVLALFLSEVTLQFAILIGLSPFTLDFPSTHSKSTLSCFHSPPQIRSSGNVGPSIVNSWWGACGYFFDRADLRIWSFWQVCGAAAEITYPDSSSRQLAFLVMTPTQTSKIFWLHLWLQPNHPKWFSPQYRHHSVALKLAPIAFHYITFCALRCVLQMHNVRMHGMRGKLLPSVEHKLHRNKAPELFTATGIYFFCSSSNNAKLFGHRFHSPWSLVARATTDAWRYWLILHI